MSEEQFKEILSKKQMMEEAAPELFAACWRVLDCINKNVGIDQGLQDYLLKVLKKASGAQ